VKKVLLLSSLTFLLLSCGDDTKIDFSLIDGKWETFSATRNGTETSTLDKSFFQFANGVLIHNINGDTIKSDYVIEKNSLVLSDPLLKELKVIGLSSDTINLETKISKFKFELLMKKINDQ